MLHWHPWWLHTTDSSSRTPTRPLLLNEPGQWSAEPWLDSQARFWDRCLESNRAWWKMCAASLPAVTWPREGVVEPPRPPAADDADAAPGEPAAPHKTPPALKRRRPVASGAARAKLERQRKR
jgi:hypothetical protein